MEIERKYLVKHLPGPLDAYERQEITQAYLIADPVVRVRRIRAGERERFVLTVKGEGMVVREEHELPLSEEKYRILLGKTEGRAISKTRYKIPLDGGLIAELDVFHGEYDGLLLVEVEFPDIATMEAFGKPEWFGEDVSTDPRYKNSELCLGDATFR